MEETIIKKSVKCYGYVYLCGRAMILCFLEGHVLSTEESYGSLGLDGRI